MAGKMLYSAPPIVLAFDKDDTCCNTHVDLSERLISDFIQLGMREELEYVQEHKDKISTKQFRKDIRDYTLKNIISNCGFMLTAGPTPMIMDKAFIPTMVHLNTSLGRMFKLVICTHRGTSELVKRNTSLWLEAFKIIHLFDAVHCIDQPTYPNKLDFLRATYPGSKILLVDDDPLSEMEKELPFDPSLLIYEGVNSYPSYKNQNKFTTVHALGQQVLALAKQ